MTTFVRNSGSANDLVIRADDGARVDLSQLSAFTDNGAGNGNLSLSATGVGSVLDIGQITALNGVSLTASSGGEVSAQLASVTNSTVTVRATHTLDLGNVTAAANTAFIAEDGAQLTVVAPVLEGNTLIARNDFLGSGGAQITTVADTYQGTEGFNLDRTIQAQGAGSEVDLSSVTTFVRNTPTA